MFWRIEALNVCNVWYHNIIWVIGILTVLMIILIFIGITKMGMLGEFFRELKKLVKNPSESDLLDSPELDKVMKTANKNKKNDSNDEK